jgi:hypothetical protein
MGLEAGVARRQVLQRVEMSLRPMEQEPLGRPLDVADDANLALTFPYMNRFEVLRHASYIERIGWYALR